MFCASIHSCTLLHLHSETARACTPRLRLLIGLSLRLGGLTDAHSRISGVNLAVGPPVLHRGYGPSSASLALIPICASLHAIVLLHYLFDGLLTDSIVSKVVKLLELVVVAALLHFFVHLADQIREGAFHVRRIQCARLQESKLYTATTKTKKLQFCHPSDPDGQGRPTVTYTTQLRTFQLLARSPASIAPNRSYCPQE